MQRPSARRRSQAQGDADLPLVPIMDAFVTLIAFLLLATSMLSVTLIDTPVPIVSNMPDNSKDKPLTLTLRIDEDQLKLDSPFNLIKPQVFPKIEKDYPFDKLHEALIEIKKGFPNEKKIIFMPASKVKYNDLVALMDASRTLFKTDPPLYVVGTDGVNKPQTDLFSEVIFGNVVSGM